MQNLKPLASLYSWAGRFEYHLVGNPEDRFLLTWFNYFALIISCCYASSPGFRCTDPLNALAFTYTDSLIGGPQDTNDQLQTFGQPHGKTNKITFAPSEDSDQPGHSPSLIRVFSVRMKKPWVLSYPLSTQWRLWSDWADAQADLSFLLGAHVILWVLSCGSSFNNKLALLSSK